MYTELKPCPFCGGKLHISEDTGGDYESKFYYIVCEDCGIMSDTYMFIDMLIEDWNRRPEQEKNDNNV